MLQRLTRGGRLGSGMMALGLFALSAAITALMGMPGVQDAAAQEEEEYEFLDPQMCGACHNQQHSQWKGSLHALAHNEAIYDRYFIQASQETDGEIELFCATCHSPIAVMNGSIPFDEPPSSPEDTVLPDKAEETGVNCDFCHSIEDYTELRNAGYVVDRSNVKRGPYEDADAQGFHESEYSELHRTAEFCAICHVVDHPVNGIHLEMTYQEYQESGYPEEGIICQDCHMNRNLGDPPYELPGKAAMTGPEREHVADHYFVGPNIVFAEETGADELKELSLKLLERAADVEITGAEVADGQVVVNVDVTNKGAGHSIPSGITELRQVWLEVVVTDADGNTVMHAGALDEQGAINDDTVIYTTIVKDAEGNATTKFWLTEEKASDYRIPARTTLSETISAEADLEPGEYTVTTMLQYRSVSPFGLSEVGMPEGEVTIPVITMTSDETTMTVE
ncbi:MAG: hypothetical protein GF320_09950 [Armatimonadia bacterium]|nr:hypothetical protein [Armatimonadia bacterium]